MPVFATTRLSTLREYPALNQPVLCPDSTCPGDSIFWSYCWPSLVAARHGGVEPIVRRPDSFDFSLLTAEAKADIVKNDNKHRALLTFKRPGAVRQAAAAQGAALPDGAARVLAGLKRSLAQKCRRRCSCGGCGRSCGHYHRAPGGEGRARH